MSNYKWLIDAGHGGLRAGKYTTAPAKMFVFPDGLTFYEGVNNREIVEILSTLLTAAGIDHALIHDPELDTPLRERVARANHLHAKDKRCIYLSIHSDCMPAGAHGKGSGFSVYTSKGQTRSDAIAEIFCDTYRTEFSPLLLGEGPGVRSGEGQGVRLGVRPKFRTDTSDGDADKEEDFYVLRNTHCPALLVENLFFDNRREAEFLLSDEGRMRIALTLLKAIMEAETTEPTTHPRPPATPSLY